MNRNAVINEIDVIIIPCYIRVYAQGNNFEKKKGFSFHGLFFHGLKSVISLLATAKRRESILSLIKKNILFTDF